MEVTLNNYGFLFPIAWIPKNTSCYFLWKKNTDVDVKSVTEGGWQWQIIEKYFGYDTST